MTNEEVNKRLVKRFEFHSMVMLKSAIVAVITALLVIICAYYDFTDISIMFAMVTMACFMVFFLSMMRVQTITQILGIKSSEPISRKLQIIRKFL